MTESFWLGGWILLDIVDVKLSRHRADSSIQYTSVQLKSNNVDVYSWDRSWVDNYKDAVSQRTSAGD